MKAKVVTCDDDVRAFYHYNKSEPPKPTGYPCVMAEISHDGGFGGPYRTYCFHYAPPHVSPSPNFLRQLYFDGLIEGLSHAD